MNADKNATNGKLSVASQTTNSIHSRGELLRPLLVVMVATFAGMLLFEWINATWLLWLTRWQSLLLTVIFTTALAVAAAYYVFRNRQKLSSDLEATGRDLQSQSERLHQCILGYEMEAERRETAEKSLLRMAKDAEGANRAKSEFLSRMSHELRTPLNSILGFAHLFDTNQLEPDERENVEQILRAGTHLLRLIDEVLDIAQLEEGRVALSLEPVRVRDVTQEVIEQAQTQSLARERNIEIRDETPSDCYVMADRQRLRQVLYNILSNAIKFNRDGGVVILECEPAADSALWRVTVSDTGSGISADNQLMLFSNAERQVSYGQCLSGIGTGLAVSRRLAELMGTTIRVESVVGEGSKFWLDLSRLENPAQQERAPSAGASEDSSPTSTLTHVTKKKQTVLYIEDNLLNLKLIQRIFVQRPEIHLLAAVQGASGLQLALQHRPDLILLDIHLPDISGIEVLSRLRQVKETRDIPVIVISADTTPRQSERLLRAGALHYFSKPINVQEFLAAIDGAIESSSSSNTVATRN